MLTVWRLDRLGRSLGDLIDLLDTIGKAGAGFQISHLSACGSRELR
ncbi:MAG: recombinase family protein [Vicinamibacterales bacterium]